MIAFAPRKSGVLTVLLLASLAFVGIPIAAARLIDDESPETGSADSAVPAGAASPAAQIGRDGKPLSTAEIALGEKVRKCLALYEPKHLNARDHSCWEVMHSLIAYGPRTEIYRDGPGGQTVNAMGWLCWSGRCQGQPMIILENGKPHGLRGVGLQGHEGQYLGMLAQWKVKPDSAMRIDGKDFTINDFIEEEKATCQSGTELTFKLIALAHYLPSDAQWTSRNREQWTIQKLLKAEIEAPIHGAACGGTHRLFGISNAIKERQKRGEPIDGEYVRAQKYIADYQRYTLASLMNPDGSFSTEWFNHPADRANDLARKLQTTGHILEWLTWSLSDEELRDPKIEKTVNFLSGILIDNPDKSWSIGPLGHGLHALMIYHQRMFTDAPLPAISVAGEPMKATPKVATSLNPPEPSCEELGDKPVNEAPTKAGAEQGDGCVEAVSQELIKVALRPSAAPQPPRE